MQTVCISISILIVAFVNFCRYCKTEPITGKKYEEVTSDSISIIDSWLSGDTLNIITDDIIIWEPLRVQPSVHELQTITPTIQSNIK
jgi:hypothetical protein